MNNKPISIGQQDKNQFGRLVCNCGWDYYLKESDTKETVEQIGWDHYDECPLRDDYI